MSSMNQLSVLCQDCGERFVLDGNVTSQEIEPSVLLHLLKCPHCQKVIPLWFETGAIIEARQELMSAQGTYNFLKSELAWELYQRKKAKFQTIYNSEQTYWKLQTAGRTFDGQKEINQ